MAKKQKKNKRKKKEEKKKKKNERKKKKKAQARSEEETSPFREKERYEARVSGGDGSSRWFGLETFSSSSASSSFCFFCFISFLVTISSRWFGRRPLGDTVLVGAVHP